MTALKVKTLNSVYELKGNTLYRNGEVYTDQLFFHRYPVKDYGWTLYYRRDGNERMIITSNVVEIEHIEQEETNEG